ncbi:hypothetical protein SPRG_16510 [Saprolegnia parasitica CBS 223.65]|uniref:ubiquitinyl hydrolase 1 n=1 Tax=Saprolegnia parasitica (strain CBS 223.65) TaxID=695850 RepID=A0A067BIR8_SAPPC|nr:hypothetical protein SPRG_16510 [Saprolegnia parasitica CBS 223.65]KDO18068.1 hypothetical protein SPRG_16510 [Saprolegnia parasitica CBS 223.65]|eukprot:XP_012211221.1 hypothetical protein SPRG_16510 [Saprolegnia parasitica CBS 223.65]
MVLYIDDHDDRNGAADVDMGEPIEGMADWRRQLHAHDSIDVQNVFGTWCAAMLLEATSSSVRVRFHNMNPAWDAWYPKHSRCLAPSSTKASNDALPFTPAQTVDLFLHTEWKTASVLRVRTDEVFVRVAGQERWVPFQPSWLAPHGCHTAAPVPSEHIMIQHTRRAVTTGSAFDMYCAALSQHELDLVQVPGDGNCLFRAISHQVYGDDQHHAVVRASCMDYMEAAKAYFEPFVVGDMPAFLRYVAHKRTQGVWGDDPELQALCELYDRPLYVFVHDPRVGASVLRTFHEASTNPRPPMRVSFYGGGHYDSVVHRRSHALHLLRDPPGTYEALRLADMQRHLSEESDALERSRLEFHGQSSLEDAFAASVAAYEAHVASTVEASELATVQAESERDALQASLLSSAQAASEHDLLQQALQASLQDAPVAIKKNEDDDEALLAVALQASLEPTASLDPYDEALRRALSESTQSYADDDDDALQLAIQQSLL